MKSQYGTSLSESQSYISYNTGKHSGLSLILLSNTSEYCGSTFGFGGFLAFVHEKLSEPMLTSMKPIVLSPGFSISVAMTLTQNERKTESFGYCKTRMNLPMFNGTVNYRSKDYYWISCLTEKILKKCACLPSYSPRGYAWLKTDFPEIQFRGPRKWIDWCGANPSLFESEINCLSSLEKRELRIDYGLLPGES